MGLDDIKLLRERVTLRTLLIALVVAALGVGLLFVAGHRDWWKNNEVWQTVIQNVGALLLVTVAISLLWELRGKRAFVDEVLAKAQISKEITFAGIVKITDSFHHDIDWKSYFQTVNKLDIFFAYGRTWRNTHIEELREAASRQGARIRVVLPDPEDQQTILELARRFYYQPEELKTLIQDAENQFRSLQSTAGAKGAQIDIWFLPATPQFTFYRFDRTAILALYSHRKERAPIPTFVCEMGGTLYDYVRKEFEAMICSDGLARRVTD